MRNLAATLAVAAIAASAAAELTMPAIFGDHMVLQTNSEYGARSFIWGNGEPGELISVNPGGYAVPVASDGTWKVQLNPSSSSRTFTMTVSGSKSANKLEFHDVVFGDVIICSGQSNMVFPVQQAFKGKEILANNASDGSRFRILSVSRSAQADPQRELPTGPTCTWGSEKGLPCSTWVPATPEAVGPFSALCYTTALYWAQTTTRHVGIINSAWGGTPVEAWMPPEAFEMCPQFPRPAPSAPSALELPPPYATDVAPADRSSAVNQFNRSALFNGMISPLVGYSSRFFLWDQGERNGKEGFSEQEYSCYFGAMINTWRDRWGIGDTAFLYAQLAPYNADSINITAIRMAQSDVVARPGGFMDTTGMVSQIDLGDPGSPWGSVHSRNKTESGRRMALQALHVMQGIQDVPFSYAVPTVVSRGSSSGSAVVSFDAATLYNGTVGLLDQPNCTTCCRGNGTFEVAASASGPWVPARAAVSGDTVVVTAPGTSPSFVRYAASNYPQCVINNAAGVPTPPFILPVGPAPAVRSTRFDPHRPLLYAGADRGTLPAALGGDARAFRGPHVGDVSLPPLYWNSWNAAHCNMDARLAMIQGDLAVKNGLFFADGGHIVHDDCWQVQRWANGSMRADPARYPNGVSEVSDYLNGKGMGFGLYTARGSRTCQNRPGSYEHEAQDAAFYAANRISYQKNDDCGGTMYKDANTSWINFRDAFEKDFGPDHMPVISVEYCRDPSQCGQWIAGVANMARTTGDIQANIAGILRNADGNDQMASVQQACGYYNDPDMLEVGAAGVTFNQSAVQLGLWSVMGSPLGLSIDIRQLSSDYLALLKNKDLIAIDQDAICAQGRKVSSDGSTDVWARTLASGDVAVALLNRAETAAPSITAKLADVGISAPSVKVYDVLRQEAVGTAIGSVAAADVAPTSLVLLRLTPQS